MQPTVGIHCTWRCINLLLLLVLIQQICARQIYLKILTKLMKRRIPVEFLVCENWFSGCSACVKWNEAFTLNYCELRCKTRFSLITILVQWMISLESMTVLN